MKMNFFILYLIAISVFSCKDELEIIQANAENPDNITVVWKSSLVSDTINCTSITPVLYNNNIIVSGDKLSGNESVILRSLNNTDGSLLWETHVPSNNNCNSLSFISGSGSFLYQNYYATLCSSDPRVIDMNNGNIVWAYECSAGRGSKITQFNDKIFHTHLTGSNPYYSGSIVMANVLSGVWDTLVTIEKIDDYSVGIYPPAVELNSSDTILYFQNRQWKSDPYDGKVDLYCYNITQDSLAWKIEDIDPEGNSAIYPPYIFNDKIYFKGSRTIFCIEKQTGEIIWSKYFNSYAEDLLYGNLLVAENQLIVKTSYESIYSLNLETGSIIWVNNDAGASPSDLVYYNGNIYYGSGGDGMIHIISSSTGETVAEFYSPGEGNSEFPEASFQYPVTIDPEKNYLYATDRYFLYCIKIDW